MILFNLKCSQDHHFEAWFKDGAAYEARTPGAPSCPYCGCAEVIKAPMAPRIARSRGEPDPVRPEPGTDAVAMAGQLRALRRKIEENCDFVGDRFAEEARRIHYGEREPRDIYGQATPAEATELKEEGVTFHQIPWLPPTNS